MKEMKNKCILILVHLGEVMRGVRTRCIILTLFSALLLPLAVPNDLFPYGSPLLGFICLAPFFISLTLAPSFRFSALLGVIFGFITTVFAYYWLQYFGEYSFWTLGGTTFGYMLYKSLLASYLHGLSRVFPKYRPLVLAMAWTFYEFLKSSGFLGFPWTLMAHPVHSFLPLIQCVDITGIWGLSFLMALINAVIAEGLLFLPSIIIKPFTIKTLFSFRWTGQLLFTLILFAAALAYGTIRLIIPLPVIHEVKVLLVQQNRDPWERKAGSYEKSILTAQELTLQALGESNDKKPDIIIWNETSFQTPFYPDRVNSRLEHFPQQKPFLPFLREINRPFLVGAPVVIEKKIYSAMNATVLISADGEMINYYGKQHPVPFGESIPFWDCDHVRTFFRNVINISGIWEMGKESTVFTLPLEDGKQITFSTPICFEDAFPDLCRTFIRKGADLLINLTNVSWSKTESAERQMYVASKFRSIENKCFLLRSTNSGVTSVIDPKGHVVAVLPLFTPDYLLVTIPVQKETLPTPYTVCGDYFPLLLWLTIVCILITRVLIPYKPGVRNGYQQETDMNREPAGFIFKEN
jgi:apolipoprotein N-acyltransferase